MKRRHFGNVRKLSSGRWQVRYRTPGGLKRTGERTFATKHDAERHLSELDVELNRGTWTDPGSRNVLLGMFAREWIDQRALAISTRDLYEDVFRLHIDPQLGLEPIGRLTPADIRRWHSGRSAVTGTVRVGHAYKLLRAILQTAVSDGLLAKNPCQIKGAGSPRSPERPYMSREQMEKLAAAMPTDMRAIVILTFWAHLRMGELLALRRDDIDLERNTVTIGRAITRSKGGPVEKTTKTGHARTVNLPTQAMDVVQRHLASTGPALPQAGFFRHHSGAPLREHHVRVAWRRARDSTGLTKFHFHDLRHAGLTHVAQAGAPLRLVQARAGHSTVRAAMIYQHMADNIDADLARRMSDVPPTQLSGEASGS